jgi:peptidoglycan hydrolase-like protein with peptidoglycan-binding domain
VRDKKKKPAAICPFPDVSGYAVKRGEHSDLVAMIQLILENLAPIYDFGAIPLSGVMDGATEAAVRRFQEVGGMEPTGEVDLDTWNRMAEEYDLACDCDER